MILISPADSVNSDFKTLVDEEGLVAERYEAEPGSCYLFRPDQYVAARWRTIDAAKIEAAIARATANE